MVAGSNFNRNLGNISPVNGGENLNSLPYFTMYRAPYRWFGSYGSVVLNATVDADSARAGIRWAEVRSADGATGWFRQQDGTFAPADGLERWMGSIAQDRDGNIALGYSVTGSNLFPSVRYTSRMAGKRGGRDARRRGHLHCRDGSTGRQLVQPLGDYSSMSVDPTDDCTFWYTQEFCETTGSFDFNARICSFKSRVAAVAVATHPQLQASAMAAPVWPAPSPTAARTPADRLPPGAGILVTPAHQHCPTHRIPMRLVARITVWTLTVTDNGGLSRPETKSVTVTSGSTLVGSFSQQWQDLDCEGDRHEGQQFHPDGHLVREWRGELLLEHLHP